MSAVAPFDWTHETYLRQGWQVVPLPPRSKVLDVPGVTGHEGKPLSLDGLRSYVGQGRNVGLRMPRNVIGIDVDDYGEKHGWSSLEAWRQERCLPPLPPTAMSSARPLPSGIRFFRVPSGFKAPGLVVPHVDVVQHRHRYAVAPPSIHPVTGTRYVWFGPDGEPAPEVEGGMLLPGIVHLAELPEEWLQALAPAPETPRPTTVASWSRKALLRALEAACAQLAVEPEGNRDNLLFWHARVTAREAIEAGAPTDAVVVMLLEAALEAGLGEAESRRTIKSGLEGKRR